MQEKKMVTSLRISKIIQLCILLLIEIAFILVLICNPSTGKKIFDSRILFTLCAFTWALFIFSQAYLFYDFYKLRSLVEESHALNKEAFLDTLTGIPNRHGIDTILKTYDPSELDNACCYIASIHNLQVINDTSGHEAGDIVIQDFCRILENAGERFGIVGRNGGNEFVAILSNATEETLHEFIGFVQEKLNSYNEEHIASPIELSSDFILNSEFHAKSFSELLAATYKKIHSQL